MWFRFCVSFQEVGVRRAAAAFFREFVFFTHIFYKISDLTRDTQILDWSHDYWWLKRKSLYHSDGFHAALLQRFNELEVLRDWGFLMRIGIIPHGGILRDTITWLWRGQWSQSNHHCHRDPHWQFQRLGYCPGSASCWTWPKGCSPFRPHSSRSQVPHLQEYPHVP